MSRPRISGSPGSDPSTPPPQAPAAPPPASSPVAHIVEDGGVFFVDVEGRRVRLADEDAARFRGAAAPRRDEVGIPAELAAAIASAQRNRELLMKLPHVISVRGGYKFTGGQITDTPAVVVAVDRKLDEIAGDEQVPPVLPDGTATDVTPADPAERMEAQGLERAAIGRPALLIDQVQTGVPEAEAEEAVPMISYVPPEGGSLDPVTGAMTVTCHVSPDAGWSVLRPFLAEAREDVVLGMYDFTAPHIYRTVRSLLRDSEVRWRQTLGPNESLPGPDDVDSTKADDKPEAEIVRGLSRVAPGRFESTFAHVGEGQTFASAYHIKVAVRDGSSFWLSSGNWQSSNQPAIDFLDAAADRNLISLYNRDWHAVIESRELAETFQLYLRHDFETAEQTPEVALEAAPAALPDLLVPVDELLAEERGAVGLEVFPPAQFRFGTQDPLTVQPILTPDNYEEVVLDLLRQRPNERLYFQNQSLNPVKTPTAAWAELLRLLADYSNEEALDVRIIFRDIGPIRKKLESLKAAGFKMDRVRIQTACHTKGIVIDSATVLLGSHNWTNQGVEVNRDASLLIRNAEIASYYERVFLHDWEHLARPAIREHATPVPVVGGEEAASADATAYRRVPWTAWMEE